MFGDMYLAIKKWWKELFCLHEYRASKEPYRPVKGYAFYQVCRKCGRWHWS